MQHEFRHALRRAWRPSVSQAFSKLVEMWNELLKRSQSRASALLENIKDAKTRRRRVQNSPQAVGILEVDWGSTRREMGGPVLREGFGIAA
jgi:hypothetical protein